MTLTVAIAHTVLAATPVLLASQHPESDFLVCVSNERSGDVSVIDSATNQVIDTIPVGKRWAII